MKRALVNAVENKVKPVKAGARSTAHLAKVVAAKHSYSRAARQAAFGKVVSKLPAANAVARAKLILKVIPSEFRIVRMPG